MIEPLLDTRGIRYGVLVGADGSIVDQVGEGADATLAEIGKAVVDSLQSTLNERHWQDMLLDFAEGPVLLIPVVDQILVVAFDHSDNLGRVRFAVRRMLGMI